MLIFTYVAKCVHLGLQLDIFMILLPLSSGLSILTQLAWPEMWHLVVDHAWDREGQVLTVGHAVSTHRAHEVL